MAQALEFLNIFGEVGLVVTILLVVIFFLAKLYLREKKSREAAEKKFSDYLINNTKEQLETTIGFSQTMDIVKEKLMHIESRLR